jgi:hypothetical protein
MSAPEYKITTVQPQKASVDSHSYYSSSTYNSGGCCGKCSEDDKRCCSCMCCTGFAVMVLVLIVKYAC